MLRNDKNEIAIKVKELEAMFQDLSKVEEENETLKKKKDGLVKGWKKDKYEKGKIIKELKKEIESLKKKDEEKNSVIEDLKKKNEGQNNVIEDLKKKNQDDIAELMLKHEAEKKVIVALKKSKAENAFDYEKSKNEIRALKKKFIKACEVINKLVRLVNIYGKNS